jgi:hypothetical protein
MRPTKSRSVFTLHKGHVTGHQASWAFIVAFGLIVAEWLLSGPFFLATPGSW